MWLTGRRFSETCPGKLLLRPGEWQQKLAQAIRQACMEQAIRRVQDYLQALDVQLAVAGMLRIARRARGP